MRRLEAGAFIFAIEKLVLKAPSELHGFLEFLGGAESNLFGCLDLDLLTGRRVASHTGRALANLQNSKTADTDTVALLQMLGDRSDEIPQHRFALLLRELVTLRELSGEMLQRDGGCRRLFVSHGMALLFLKQPARNI